ncbi:translesion DNA synthesis-associated protein ImuA [Variovorax paradoxus]|uniref:translesion DNA synthesis-associated protein ImuA n=1 Tax=Variovorax paradoxus TaxID=34073 RepID=UPI0035219B06
MLPHAVEAAVRRGDALGTPVTSAVSTGFERLDTELPGGGWPCQSLTEVLQVQPSVLEWRLLAPAMRTLVGQGRQIVVIGPPKAPHLPGLHHLGLDERHLVWIAADKPVERLWATEQLIKANAAGMLVSWLPQARQEQIRRLQVCAQGCDGPVILCRPAAAEHEASAAPLRLQARFGLDWELRIHLLKRKGPPHVGELTLPSVPGGLEAILTPRLRHPSRLIAARQSRELSHAVGSPSSRQPAGRPAAAH